MRTTVTFNDAELKLGIDNMRKRFPYAIRRALKRCGVSGRAEMAKLISADTGISSRKVSSAIKVSEVGDSSVTIEVTGTRIPLIEFNARGPEPSRGRGRGVSYRLTGGAGRIPDAFITTLASGHRGVFKRAGKRRLPIIELFGPSMVKVFEKYLPQGVARARESLVDNLRSEINFAMSRK